MGHSGALLRVAEGQVAQSRTSRGALLYAPEKLCNIILACSFLHNIALVNGLPLMCRRCQDADLHLGKVSLLASVSSLHVRPQWARPLNQEYLRA